MPYVDCIRSQERTERLICLCDAATVVAVVLPPHLEPCIALCSSEGFFPPLFQLLPFPSP